MKKIVLTLLSVAFLLTANAQFYNLGSANRSGRMNIYGGMAMVNSTVLIASPFTSGEYIWESNSFEEAENVSFSPGMFLGFSMSALNDKTETFKLGGMFGIDYYTHAWSVDWSGYTFDVKSKDVDIAMGVAGEVLFAEKIGISFEVAPYVDILFGQQVKSSTTVASATVSEYDWHDAKKNGFDLPNMDIGIFGRVGANYHFSETMFAGLLLQYRKPLFNIGANEPGDVAKGLDYSFEQAEIKRTGLSLMLTFGIDID